MPSRNSHSNDGSTERLPSDGRSHLSLRAWALHWASALLVLFLLVTSLGPGFGLTNRFPANWMNDHLSTGVALFALTLIRLVLSGLSAPALKGALLLVTLATTVTGLVIYQSPPLGRGNFLFGSIVMPTLLRLEHTIHGKIIIAHMGVSVALLGMVLVHIAAGLRHDVTSGRSQFSFMLWPWR